ncbi:protein tplate [Quercus suber]|uniref:Protein tplate n=1 Tax=Quercus suber TaxID=58331 RepID=A0AAW0LYW7_QUESU
MDILYAQIQADLRSNDALRQTGALLQALQQSAAGRDISILAKSAVEEIVASPASAVSKKLAFDLIRSTRLTSDLWDTVITGVRSDLDFPDPDVTAAAISILSALPSHRLSKLLTDSTKEINTCFDSISDNLRFSITETLGCILARDDVVTLCENSVSLLDRVSTWWARIGLNMLDRSDNVSKVAFESVGRLFQEFDSKRMSRLAGDKLVDSENSLAIRSNWVSSMVDFVWKKRNALMARSLVLPVESFRATVFPIVYAVKAVASDAVEVIRKLSKSSSSSTSSVLDSNAERFVGVSDVVSHLAPFLASSLDPALIYEVGINMLYLADVPGGKTEWASLSIIAILTLWIGRNSLLPERETSSAGLTDRSRGTKPAKCTKKVDTCGDVLTVQSGGAMDPVLSSVTVGVTHFERCALWVQVLYYPFYGSGAAGDYEGDYTEEDPQIMRQKRSLRPELGEPVILRCQPYKIPLTELLLPHKISPVEFFRLWPSLPAVIEYTGTYTYEGSGFKATAAQQYGESPFLSGLKSLSSKPFHRVCSHIIRTVAGFQLCFAAKTWYGGFLGMMIFGASEVSRNVDLGDETTTMMCKFVVRASDASITKEIGSDLQGWLDDLTDGGVEYMPEDEVKVAAAERLRISMERIALLKAAQPRPKTPKSDDENEDEDEDEDEEDEDKKKKKKEKKKDGEEDGKTKGPSTLSKLTAEEAEHRALQAAVLQEWHMLCKEMNQSQN